MERLDARTWIAACLAFAFCAGMALAGGQDVSLFEQNFKGTWGQDKYASNQWQTQYANRTNRYQTPVQYQHRDYYRERYDLDRNRHNYQQRQAFVKKYRAVDNYYHSWRSKFISSMNRKPAAKRQQMQIILRDGDRVYRDIFSQAKPGGRRQYDPQCLQYMTSWLQRYGGMQDAWYDCNYPSYNTDSYYSDYWYKPEYPFADWKMANTGAPEPDFFDAMGGNYSTVNTGYTYTQPNYTYTQPNYTYTQPNYTYTQPNYQYVPQQPVYVPQQPVYVPSNGNWCGTPQINYQLSRQPIVMGNGVTMHTMNIADGIFHIASGSRERDDLEVFGGILSTAGNIMILGDLLN